MTQINKPVTGIQLALSRAIPDVSAGTGERDSKMKWFPFWTDKWIFGSMRIECTIIERAIWIDLLALASKDNGFIRANEETPYLITQLAGMLVIKEDQLRNAIHKFIRSAIRAA